MQDTTIRQNLALALCAVFAAFAQLPPSLLADQQTTGQAHGVVFPTDPVIPQRDAKFQVSDEPYSMRLFAADPKLLQQRYVATVRLAIFSDTGGDRNWFDSDELRGLFWSATFRRVSVPNLVRGTFPGSRAELFLQLANNVPDERKPAEDIMACLSNPDHHIRVEGSPVLPFSTDGPDLELQVLAPDLENAKTKALALLDLYDYGLSHPIQKHLIAQMQGREAQLPELLAKLKTEEAKIEPLETSLKDYEPISDETMSDLKTQQRMVSVDMAGAKARIRACSGILQRDDVRGKPISEQVESVKITAEIELVGLTARKEALDEIIQQGTKRRELTSTLADQRIALNKIQSQIQRIEGAIEQMEATRKSFMPFPIRDNTITIRPIKWVPGDARSAK